MSAFKRTVASVAIAALTVGVQAPAKAQSADEAEDEFDLSKYESETDACVWTQSIRDFSVIDRQNLVIEASGRKRYLVTLFSPCFGLNFAPTLAFESRTSRICGRAGDKIYPRRGETCFIRDIIRVESRDVAERIVEAREGADDD